MPAVGAQHRLQSGGISGGISGANNANPYDETTRLSEYTAQQIATLQSRLDKQLGPEYLSTRQGPGGQRVHYIAADKCINLANEVFGFNGWSSSIQNVQVDFVDEDPKTGKISLGISVIIRVTLKDGTFHEDVGYGHIENCKGKAAAFEKAKKEGTTDALKRALRTFGNVLGNCIYDKEYLTKVTKVKAAPTKWDVGKLHRHSDFEPVRKAAASPVAQEEKDIGLDTSLDASTTTEVAVAAEFEADFGSDLFDEADFSEQHPLRPDEVALDQPPAQSNGSPDRAHANHNGHNSRIPGHLETPSKPQRTGPLGPPERSVPLPQPVDRVRPNMPPGNHVSTPISKPPQPYQRPPAPADTAKPTPGRPVHPSANQPPSNTTNQAVAKPEVRSPTKPPSPLGSQLLEEGCPEELAGKFLSLRALIDKPAASIKSVPAFNPRAESPSIRKTAGFDHSTSAPVTRNTYQILPPQSRSVSPSHIVPPPSSQVGLPAIAASDVARRNVNNQGFASPMTRSPMTTSYRPPTRRSLAASNTNTNANPANPASAAPGMQNVNGKRPPLSDMTNVTSASGDDKGYVPDASKRPKIGDGEGNGPRAPVAGRQGQQAFRTSGPSS